MGTSGRNQDRAKRWSRLAGWLLALAACLCTAIPASAANPPLRLDAGESSFALSDAIRYWHEVRDGFAGRRARGDDRQ